MKLLEPFSGYSLANGIAIFHIALFAGTFFVKKYNQVSDEETDPDITKAFRMLRVSHVCVAILSIIATLCDIKKVPDDYEEEPEGDEKEKALETEEKEKEKLKEKYVSMNQGSNYKIIASFCQIISIFQYSICVFYA